MIRIGNASGFYGDRFTAWREMLDGGELDVLTGDYLAELTMLILARDRMRDPDLGYAKTFLRQLETCLGTALDRGVRIVTNAGGLNPAGLAAAIEKLADRLGLPTQVGYVEGDTIQRPDALSANAYLGAFGIAACLDAGADVVVTGRVTDASLVVGAAIARYGWGRDDLDELAGATVAGHLVECGAQVTGGNFSFFTELPDGGHRPGFPIAEVHPDGSSVLTKHPGTGGAVTVETVTAQLLYEIGGPSYLGPDVVTRLDTVTLHPDGPDRVRVSGVRGTPPPPTLKVGVNNLGGFRNSMTFVLCGLDIEAKAALVRGQVEEAVGKDGLEFTLARTDHPDAADTEAASALLHVHLRDGDKARAGRAFSAAAVELALASYPGCTLTTLPGDATPYGVFTADAVPQDAVSHVAVLPGGERAPVAPPIRTAPTSQDESAPGGEVAVDGPTRRGALGEVVGARSGDKGGDANLGVWARSDAGYAWLRTWLTVERLAELVPETAPLPVRRYELSNLRAVNFVIEGLLGAGVAASTRFDPQAKALGELLRARIVDLPADLPTGASR
ncbi:Phosphatidylcholine--retinol O-acyltransferase [Micromonospora saelicesensis]|uniref:Phosphatidylcholine--retinol O-acyltransferase n=2 Tax=Micromonospora saelicesensis TaxID=285676 RepID=A0ABX9CRA3_9ACTN|nr:acyclic terpene utilization AtuA family protein [Micromonospora saelicesensis]RAO05604.1 Phosphatidylcholine--retinol O-acyltransferase [Micromonospora saelicesensis]RAO46208.1 Phosphatidylcholine--retinol O-acyltransferase [Micromonospora saelicesensis]